MKYKISFNGKEFLAEGGELLSDALIRNRLLLTHPCGGKGICGKCRVFCDGVPVLACKYIITRDAKITTVPEGEILSETADSLSGEVGGTDLVLDLGTTTLALALIDKRKKCIVKVIKATNPQRAFGADVISRIEYCQKNGVGALTDAIRTEISRMIRELGEVELDRLYVAGNTTMLHIFAGVDPSSMGSAPYTPTFLGEIERCAKDLGISGVRSVRLLPSISAFVGADIVAGINCLGLPREGYRLLLDLGTNAEIALFSKDRIITTSAAAGPCFEGACISSGMSASDGAIYYYDGVKMNTVNNYPARGICATGLVDIIAFLLKRAKIDASGILDEEEFEVAPGVSLTQDDIRQYQLAKSAIYSAILTIMEKFEVGFEEIEALYIAGGFSSKMSPQNAALTGLIPKELAGKCYSIGNSSLMGAIDAALEDVDLTVATDMAVYYDLSSDTTFADMFLKNMNF